MPGLPNIQSVKLSHEGEQVSGKTILQRKIANWADQIPGGANQSNTTYDLDASNFGNGVTIATVKSLKMIVVAEKPFVLYLINAPSLTSVGLDNRGVWFFPPDLPKSVVVAKIHSERYGEKLERAELNHGSNIVFGALPLKQPSKLFFVVQLDQMPTANVNINTSIYISGVPGKVGGGKASGSFHKKSKSKKHGKKKKIHRKKKSSKKRKAKVHRKSKKGGKKGRKRGKKSKKVKPGRITAGLFAL